ncbi:MAG: hypothetical protein ABH881_03465 [bacterium]
MKQIELFKQKNKNAKGGEAMKKLFVCLIGIMFAVGSSGCIIREKTEKIIYYMDADGGISVWHGDGDGQGTAGSAGEVIVDVAGNGDFKNDADATIDEGPDGGTAGNSGTGGSGGSTGSGTENANITVEINDSGMIKTVKGDNEWREIQIPEVEPEVEPDAVPYIHDVSVEGCDNCTSVCWTTGLLTDSCLSEECQCRCDLNVCANYCQAIYPRTSLFINCSQYGCVCEDAHMIPDELQIGSGGIWATPEPIASGAV